MLYELARRHNWLSRFIQLKKRGKTTRSLGGGWKKTTSAGRTYFYYNGKRKSKKQYKANDRKRKAASKEAKENAGKKEQKFKGEFCHLKNREDFYTQILADRKAVRDKIGEERASDLQLWFQIGDGQKRKKKSDKRIQYTHGLRKFVSLKKARMFLGIGASNYQGDHPLPKWSKRGKLGVCQFEKKAFLVESRRRGTRAVAPKIHKKYIIQEKFER